MQRSRSRTKLAAGSDQANFMIDNSRVVTEFGMQFRPYRERVLQIINVVRAEEGKQPITVPSWAISD
jgi:hypothetical protein